MVSKTLLVWACLLAVVASAPQYTTPSYQNLDFQSLPYQSQAGYQYLRDSPLPAYYQASPAAAPRKVAAIVSQTQDLSYDGTYNFAYQSEDGSSVQTSGAQRALGPEEQGQAASGSYSYIAPDGTPITTTWYADETGFHAQGDHLPKGPEGYVRSL